MKTKKTGEVVKFTNSLLQALEGITDYAVYFVNKDGLVTEWNEGAELTFGFSKDEIVGTHAGRLYESHIQERIPLLHNGWMTRKDGTRFLAQITTSPLRVGSKEPQAYLCIVQDITNQAGFAKVVAHELRNTLVTITAILDFLLLKFRSQQALINMEKHLKTLQSEVLRLNSMLNDLTESYLLYCGYDSIKLTKHNWVQIIQEAFEIIRNTVFNEPPRLKLITYPSADLYVLADRRRIIQLLHNLVYNALQYSSPTSPIELIVDSSESCVSVAVKDYGTNVPKEKLAELLQFKGKIDQTLSPGGMGIGLSFCREIARLHGGTLDLHSTKGQGTTVTLRLPLLKTTQKRNGPA
ncbi:MAG: PAS domain-containing sensor histidine kinase [Firmicutes bacterium]|nr:PAS domain-containing sensor histidine kinase [Bacillota bacterium]